MSTHSLAGALYYVIFVDDYSRKSNEVLSKFKEYKALVENQTGKKIKTLMSDNGGEYTFDSFKEFYKSVGIKREYIVPYNPHQNGVAERKNRTIIEAAKAMVHDQNIHISFWVEAANTTLYIQNRYPHAILENTTPEEVFTGNKPDLSHLRVFGCPVYVHVPKEKRTKLEPSGKKGIFIGYNEDTKGYRIYIPGQRSVEISRDVKFEENFISTDTEDDSIIDLDRDLTTENERENNTINSEPTSSNIEPTPSNIEPTCPNVENNEISNNKKRPLWARKMFEENNVKLDQIFGENKRTRTQKCYTALLTELIEFEPDNVEKALTKQSWREAMIEEYQSILKNDVWDVVSRPKDKSFVSSKWLVKTKYAPDGSIEKHKARFVAKGFSQNVGIDYEETFAPVARYTSVRTILAIATSKGWKVHQMDVKTAFLNGKIEEEVYIEQPEGFITHDKDRYVYKLKKALYGLKQAPRAWYERIDNYLTKLG